MRVLTFTGIEVFYSCWIELSRKQREEGQKFEKELRGLARAQR